MRMSSLIPRFYSYQVLTAPPALVAGFHMSTQTDAVIETIDANSLERIEYARPGYSSRAQRYLDAGHIGFAVCVGGDIHAMAWARLNEASTVRRVAYFPLQPGHVWLHADWTHESHRGKGHHKALILHRAKYAQERWPCSILTANIDKHNLISIRNYENLGFRITGTLRTVNWLRNYFGGRIK